MPASHPASAFLSVRLPEAERDRLKVAAAARGETVQGLVGQLAERFLAEEDQASRSLSVVVSRLRAHAQALTRRGVTSLWVFGSVARGDARPDSDVDLLAQFDPSAPLSLVGLASLRAELSDLLGAPADLVERGASRPAVREAAKRKRCASC